MAKVEKKEDTRGTRIEAAQRLTRLAGIIAQGHADILGREVVLGDQVESCWSVNIRDGFIHYDLSLKIPLSEPGQPEPCCRMPQPEGPTPRRQGRGGGGGRVKGAGKGRYEAKKLKKTTGALWKIVKKAVQDRRAVADEDAQALVSNLNDYGQYVEDEWRSQWEACVQAAKECVEATKRGDFKGAEALMKEVNDLTKACHKKYK